MISGCWAAMLKFGKNGYKEMAADILKAQTKMRNAFKNDPDIIVISEEASPIFGFTSNTINCIALCEQMSKRRKWTVARCQKPASAHIALTQANCHAADDFIDSLRECIKVMKADKSLNQNHETALYGMTGMIPDNSFLRAFVCNHQAAMLDTLE